MKSFIDTIIHICLINQQHINLYSICGTVRAESSIDFSDTDVNLWQWNKEKIGIRWLMTVNARNTSPVISFNTSNLRLKCLYKVCS
jgi:hypothetical protein